MGTCTHKATSIADVLRAISAISARADLSAFVARSESGAPCPWKGRESGSSGGAAVMEEKAKDADIVGGGKNGITPQQTAKDRQAIPENKRSSSEIAANLVESITETEEESKSGSFKVLEESAVTDLPSSKWFADNMTDEAAAFWSLKTPAQLRTVSMEALLLSTSFLETLSPEHQNVVADVLRVQLGINTAAYKQMSDILELADAKNPADPTCLLSLPHRLSIMRAALTDSGENKGACNGAWWRRELSAVLGAMSWQLRRSDCILWSVNGKSMSSEEVMTMFEQQCRKVLESVQKESDDHRETKDALDLFKKQILGLVQALDVPPVRVMFPEQIANIIYETLMFSILDYVSTEDKGDDSSDDTPPQLISEWKHVVHAVRNMQGMIGVTPQFEDLTLLRIFFTLIRSSRSEQMTALGVLKSFTEDEAITELNESTVQVLAHIKQTLSKLTDKCSRAKLSEKDIDYDSAHQRAVLDWMSNNMNSWLVDFHRSQADVVGDVFEIYTSTIKLRFLDESSEEIEKKVHTGAKMLLELSAGKEYTRLRGTKDKLFNEPETWKTLALALSDSFTAERVYTRALIKSLPFDTVKWSLLRLCSLFAADFSAFVGRVDPEDEAARFLAALRAARFVTVDTARVWEEECAAGENEENTPGMSVLAEVLPNTQKTCESLVSQWIDTQKSRSHEWLDRCLQADSWSPVDDKCMFSSSIVDIFSVLDSLLNGYSAMLQRFLPDGANTLGAFCDLINAIITVYANSLVQLSGQVEDIAPIYELLLKPIKKQLSLKRFKTFTGTEISSTSSTTSLKPASEHNLASQSIEVLCVRLNCLHFAHEKIAALAKRAGETCKKLGGGWEADPWGLGGVYKFEGKVETTTVKCSIDFDPA
eukprot:50522_1